MGDGAQLHFTRLRDPGAKDRVSGVDHGATSVTWGDGKSTDGATSTASHTYKKTGKYSVTVTAADAAGNRVAVRRTVQAG